MLWTPPKVPTQKRRKMPSLAADPGIPIPAEEIRRALESVAIPGFTGSLQMELHFSDEAAELLGRCVVITVLRRETKRIGEEDAPVTRQQLPDPTRKKPVEKVIADLKKVLMIQTVLKALEVQVVDGVLQKMTKQE
jgi:hypothetical protein